MLEFLERFGVIVLSFVGPLLIGWAIVAVLDRGQYGKRRK